MYGIAGLGRFRVSAFRQRGWVGLVLRRVPARASRASRRSACPARSRDARRREQHGLVLVTGLAGSGKTATLAAMVDHVNQHREGHIVTIEDPVEVLHADKRSIVDQREVGTDTPIAVSGLEHALRQDPDVDRARPAPDADAAWARAPGGRDRAPRARGDVDGQRDRHASTGSSRCSRRTASARRGRSLAATLRGIVSQRLLPRAGGRGRVPAVEVLVVNARVRERIHDPTARPSSTTR